MLGEYEVAAHGWEVLTQRLLVVTILERPETLIPIGSVFGWCQGKAVC